MCIHTHRTTQQKRTQMNVASQNTIMYCLHFLRENCHIKNKSQVFIDFSPFLTEQCLSSDQNNFLSYCFSPQNYTKSLTIFKQVTKFLECSDMGRTAFGAFLSLL